MLFTPLRFDRDTVFGIRDGGYGNFEKARLLDVFLTNQIIRKTDTYKNDDSQCNSKLCYDS
jgi:hypothetical protein